MTIVSFLSFPQPVFCLTGGHVLGSEAEAVSACGPHKLIAQTDVGERMETRW